MAQKKVVTLKKKKNSSWGFPILPPSHFPLSKTALPGPCSREIHISIQQISVITIDGDI